MNYESLNMLADLYGVTIDFILGRDGGLLLNEGENIMVKMYRAIDTRGKKNVDAVLLHEYAQAQPSTTEAKEQKRPQK